MWRSFLCNIETPCLDVFNIPVRGQWLAGKAARCPATLLNNERRQVVWNKRFKPSVVAHEKEKPHEFHKTARA